jgi:hypothetical protein
MLCKTWQQNGNAENVASVARMKPAEIKSSKGLEGW